MNKRRLLLIGGLGLLLCTCMTVFLFMSIGDDAGQETAQRASDTIDQSEDEAQATDTPSDKTAEGNVSSGQEETEVNSDPTSAPTDNPTPTDEPTPTLEPTATPIPPLGLSRGNPFPIDTLVEAPNWDIQVVEVIRGDEAWTQIQTANQFNDPPPEGMEYLLVRIKAKSTYADSESHRIGGGDFKVTGDHLVYYSEASVVTPNPELSAELFTGGETEGWVPFTVGTGEGSLMLVVDELFSFNSDRYRFIALDEDASIVVDSGLFDIEPTTLGTSRSAPAPLGETVVTDDWEVTVTDVIRGDEAWSIVQAANQFNDPPSEGMEYVAVKLAVRFIGTVDRAVNISGGEFDLTGEANILYDWPPIVDPEPELDVYLYPGGQFEGWTVMEAQKDEGHLMVRFEPLFEFSDDEVRYLALVDDASVSVPVELAEIRPNGLGKTRANPASLGQTVVTDDWEFTILEVVRGNDALLLVQEANQFNDPPDPGIEYVAIRVHARNVNSTDRPEDISDGFFSLVDDSNVEYDLPPVVEPEPKLDIELYPGGEYEGWVVLQASEGGNSLIAVISPFLSFETIYMALEP